MVDITFIRCVVFLKYAHQKFVLPSVLNNMYRFHSFPVVD